MTRSDSPAVIPTTDAAAALEFCRRLAGAVSHEQTLRWPGGETGGHAVPDVSIVIPVFNEELVIPELSAG